MKHSIEWCYDTKLGHFAACEKCSWHSEAYPTRDEAIDAASAHMLADWGQ